MVRRHKRKTRRGVVILVVLTLLTLLIVVGLTFTVLSGHYRRASEANARRERYGDNPKALIDRAMYQLVRDTPNDSRSVIKGHSLLRDLYGNDWVLGRVETAPATATEFLTITVAAPFTGFSDVEGHYNGCVLSFIDPVFSPTGSSITAESTRIVRYRPILDATGAIQSIEIIIEWTVGEGGVKFYPVANTTRFVINGRPFNGTGAGYNSGTYLLNQMFPSSSYETALLPNYRTYADLDLAGAGFHPNLGGLDEPWDAVDFQNMFLAMNPPNAAVTGIIPSFHRPALVNYWLKRLMNDNPGLTVAQFRDPSQIADAALQQQVLNLKRSIILRPLREDHPNFPNGPVTTPATQDSFNATMGQPDASPPTGPQLPQMVWDVDNDGDGIPDSIWIDIGLPIQTDASGRRYKPLVAVLCQDLDGRLNVNAHSNYSHNDDWYAELATGMLKTTPADTDTRFATLPPYAGPPPNPPLLPRGLGYGPADIYLGHLFPNELGNLMTERYNHVSTPFSTWGGGESNVDDPLSLVKNVGNPMLWYSTRSKFGTPTDMMGIAGIGLDITGHPLAIYLGRNGQTVGDPYEMVLNRKSAGYTDSPFTLAEEERVLRYDDIDSVSLPGRLLRTVPNALVGNTPDARRNRRAITTHSSHIPVPNGVMPLDWRDDLGTANNIVDAFRAQLVSNMPSATPDEIENELRKIVPWEILHGERFNVNRWFGNGLDDNGNSVVDEPGETLPSGDPEIIWPNATNAVPTSTPPVVSRQMPASFRNVPFDHLNDDNQLTGGATMSWQDRQIYARQLYCLMMLLNDGFPHPTQELGPSGPLTARRIAQWAINVVDFRDSDAIMTPFEYDANPWDGWGVDGDLTTPDAAAVGGVVWGLEYPDLLLSESLAFHDVRVKDTSQDTSGESFPDDGPDQYRIPQGSLYLEFYCPRNRPNNYRFGQTFAPDPSFPPELYDPDGMLNLARMGGGPGGQFPVWRVAISEEAVAPAETPLELRKPGANPDTTTFDPDRMSLIDPAASMTIERYVWFAPKNPASVLPTAEAQKVYWNRSGAANARVEPTGYLVVGPRIETRIGSQVQSTPPTRYAPSEQRISLLPGMVQYSNSAGLTPPPFDYPPGSPTYALVRPSQTMVAAANPPVDAAGNPIWDPSDYGDTLNLATTRPDLGITLANPYGIGLNVTEPVPMTNYYREPETRLKSSITPPDPDAFPLDSYYDYDNPSGASRFPDEPFDVNNAELTSFNSVANLDDTGAPGAEFQVENAENFRTAFLQRLANPLLPYDPVSNPYITVDWIPIDVTILNGEDDVEDSALTFFEARERNGDGTNRNIWSQETDTPDDANPAPAPPAPATGEYFAFTLGHSLGYLNRPYGGTLGVPAVPQLYAGDPAAGPFPWLAWNNRPFANALELMQVPTSSPSRLLHEFDIFQGTGIDPYNSSDPTDWQTFRGHFPHLWNFFHCTDLSGASPTASSNLYRLFEYVETPSPFVGAEKWYNPVTMASVPLDAYHYRPPFNHLSRFQDPGRININTIFDTATVYPIWEGLAKGYPAMDPSIPFGLQMFQRIMLSRRGFNATNPANFYELNSDVPTLFGNPFRPADSADLMPTFMVQNRPVDASLLRSDVLDTTRDDALFVPTPSIVEPYQDNTRNPYFRYHGLARLSNLVSNNSNVFAVWITVGLFEVEQNPNGVDMAHPDGYRLGAELGTDTGNVKRHRAFYIIDRSEPVAFEPGKNHNVDRAVKLRRFIE